MIKRSENLKNNNFKIDNVTPDNFTQKIFFKHSFLNAFMLLKLFIIDFFKYFLSNIKSVSRYEFWFYFFANIVVLIIVASVLILISIALPFLSFVAKCIFYMILILSALISFRVYAGRLLNVKKYVLYVKVFSSKYIVFYKLEKFFLKLFFSYRIFYIVAFMKLTILSIYLLNTFLYDTVAIRMIDILYSVRLIDFIIFILKSMGVVYFVFAVAPSTNKFDYLEKNNIPYYPIFEYNTRYSKDSMVDYFSLLSIFFVLISIGYIFIVGYSLSLHIVICLAIVTQGITLMFSIRFFSFIMGLFSIMLIIYTNIIFAFFGFESLFLTDDTVFITINYYQTAIAMIFLGMLYHSTFDKDLIKIISVISFFLSIFFMMDDYIVLKGLVGYNSHSFSIAIYLLVELVSIFIFLYRIAYNKEKIKAHTILKEPSIKDNMDKNSNIISVKQIYTILCYSSIAMVIYATFMWLIPFVFNITNDINTHIELVSVSIHLRDIISFYIFIGLFLLFRYHNNTFLMLISAVLILCETYILLFNSINALLSGLRIYPIEYIYLFLYVLLFVVSVYVKRYDKTISLGYSLSLILILIYLLEIFLGIGHGNNIFLYNILFISFIISNIFVVVGSYNKLQDVKKMELQNATK